MQREKEKLNKFLQKQLDVKQSLELEAKRLRGAFKVTRLLDDQDDDFEVMTKMDEIQDELREKEEELTMLKNFIEHSMSRSGRNNDELQDAC